MMVLEEAPATERMSAAEEVCAAKVVIAIA
jgi:hypothetical protein